MGVTSGFRDVLEREITGGNPQMRNVLQGKEQLVELLRHGKHDEHFFGDLVPIGFGDQSDSPR